MKNRFLSLVFLSFSMISLNAQRYYPDSGKTFDFHKRFDYRYVAIMDLDLNEFTTSWTPSGTSVIVDIDDDSKGKLTIFSINRTQKNIVYIVDCKRGVAKNGKDVFEFYCEDSDGRKYLFASITWDSSYFFALYDWNKNTILCHR
jgi:hypothetical protein